MRKLWRRSQLNNDVCPSAICSLFCLPLDISIFFRSNVRFKNFWIQTFYSNFQSLNFQLSNIEFLKNRSESCFGVIPIRVCHSLELPNWKSNSAQWPLSTSGQSVIETFRTKSFLRAGQFLRLFLGSTNDSLLGSEWNHQKFWFKPLNKVFDSAAILALRFIFLRLNLEEFERFQILKNLRVFAEDQTL